ncbi:MAG: DUF3990 domain-containing protein [Paludibacteraceae bacterium]|nr:DUF3990 domain-containing protein [Paludibacteraceae bacterium]MBO5346181.1 DUF3990 domain-containing protein [Paludibacteraceae bacterium]
MNEIIVYHGGTERVEMPVCKFGRRNLDFGLGFYVTNLREQAVSWAYNMAKSRNMPALLNRYRLDRDAIFREAKCRVFEAYDEEWLDFIVANRSGMNVADEYDYVEGGVANDRVVDTVNLYIAGLIELGSALKELSKHQPNNQMCILNQEILNKYLVYEGTEEL